MIRTLSKIFLRSFKNVAPQVPEIVDQRMRTTCHQMKSAFAVRGASPCQLISFLDVGRHLAQLVRRQYIQKTQLLH